MSLYAIGDVHGCARTLDALLARLRLGPDDTVVFIGDYVDRGPDSRAVLDRLLALEADAAAGRGPRAVFLRGNHDQMMLDFVDHGDFALWRVNGGLATLAGYADTREDACGLPRIPEAHVDFLRRTRLVYDTPDYCFVHAGLRPELSVAENLRTGTAKTFLWERAHLDAPLDAWEKTVVCGHTPQAAPLSRPRLINIDTGAVYNEHPGFGRLTAVRLPAREFVQVEFEG